MLLAIQSINRFHAQNSKREQKREKLSCVRKSGRTVQPTKRSMLTNISGEKKGGRITCAHSNLGECVQTWLWVPGRQSFKAPRLLWNRTVRRSIRYRSTSQKGEIAPFITTAGFAVFTPLLSTWVPFNNVQYSWLAEHSHTPPAVHIMPVSWGILLAVICMHAAHSWLTPMGLHTHFIGDESKNAGNIYRPNFANEQSYHGRAV